MINYFKKNKKLFFITVLFFLIQLPFLDQLSLLRGERDIMLSGYSLAKTGKDLYGNLLSLEFLGIDPYVPFVPIYMAALWWLFIPIKTVFIARLFFVLISLTLPFLINEIIKHITKDSKISFWTAVIFCFSPGIFHLTRLTLEIGVAFPLLLGGILTYFKKKRILAYLLFFLSFFSYHGFRPLIPVLLIYLSLFEFIETKRKAVFIKQCIFHGVFFLALVGLSIFIDGRLMQSRISDVAFSGFEKWSNEVIYRRNTSQAMPLVASVFDNKVTAMSQYIRDVFFRGIDLKYLFINGDESSLYASTFSGQFFIIGALFYLFGLFYLGKKLDKRLLYVAGFIFIGLVPSLTNISYVSYSIRSILSSVGHAFIMALGIFMFFELLSKWNINLKRICIGAILLFFSVELGFFVYNYYFRRFITMSEMFFEAEKQVAEYVIKNPRPYKIYTDNPRTVYFSYLFFNNKIDISKSHIATKNGEPYKLGGLEIIKCPVNPRFTHHNEIIMDTCLTEKMYRRYVGEKKFNDRIDYTNYSFKTAYFIFN